MEWQDYISYLLSQNSSFDGINLSLDDDSPVRVPPIIKATILMLDRMQECQGKHNILVFPERIQSIFVFTLVKLLYNISEGRIERAYSPESFLPGEKLRFGKSIFEFIRVENKDGKKYMRIRLADLEYSAPIDYLPLFQKTTAQRISPWKKFAEAKKEAESLLLKLNPNEQYLKLLSDYKTHMDSSIVNMTSIINTKAMIASCKLCGKNIKDSILIGQADYEGNVKNIGAGQLGGIPAIVLASDLYAISALAQKGHHIQSIIIDGSNANALLSQMDALDELVRLNVPVTCVTDVVNSFDLQPFLDRGFNLWRWDESSITEKLYDATRLSSDKKVKNCAKRKIEYLVTAEDSIGIAMQKLSSRRNEAQELSAPMLKMFDQLYGLAFSILRETVPVDGGVSHQALSSLENCAALLSGEKNYISSDCFEDYSTVIKCLKNAFSNGVVPPKHDALMGRLKEKNYDSICLIAPERSEKSHIQKYWQEWCSKNGLKTLVTVLLPAEYYQVQCARFDSTIVVGWFKRAIMRKILYSFNTQEYLVLLYDCEKKWKNYDTYRWRKALDSCENRKTIERAFKTDQMEISVNRFIPATVENDETPVADEYAEIETVLRENKYRRYVAGGGKKAADQTVEAVPVNYVGGYIAFYRMGHKVISASNIIENDSDKIDTVLPQELKLGDFVVVREADRDLIREIADNLLGENHQETLRELATKWKEALQIETLFNTDEEIYERLKDAGCTRGYPTVRSWLHDEDYIAPQDKQDLEYIIAITGNEVLRDLKEQIFEAAQSVRIAHVQAGRVLSAQLKQKIVEELDKYGDIDPFNIWEPIEMQVEGIGVVRILKIIDIGIPVVVDISDTNRLIDEE